MAESKVVSVRLPDALIERIDAHAARLRLLTGIHPRTADVIKLLLERGLAAVEADAQHGRKR